MSQFESDRVTTATPFQRLFMWSCGRNRIKHPRLVTLVERRLWNSNLDTISKLK